MNFEIQSTFKSTPVSQRTVIAIWLLVAALANLLFYRQSIGINLFVFGVVVVTGYVLSSRVNRGNLPVIVSTMIIGLGALYQGTALGVLLLLVSLCALAGMTHTKVRMYFTGFLAGLFNWFKAPGTVRWSFRQREGPKEQTRGWKKSVRLGLIPALLVLVFSLFYLNGNQFLNQWWSAWVNIVFQSVEWFFDLLEWGRIWFFLLMLIATAGLVFWNGQDEVVALEKRLPITLTKRKGKLSSWEYFLINTRLIPKLKMTGLTYELKLATLILISLNVVIMISNATDLVSLLGQAGIDPSMLYKHVHEGTAVLSISLVCSALLILYFFRGNLNFYRENQWLRQSGKVWLAQNILLILLIAIRNWQYINYFGPTHKRLGVYYFLLLMSIGIVLVWRKIDRKDSGFSILKNSLYAVFLSLIVLGPINWDGIIARNHLAQSRSTSKDLEYVMQLSDAAIPALIQYNPKYGHYEVSPSRTIYSYTEMLELKIRHFQRQSEHNHWASWSFLDHEIRKSIKSHYQPYQETHL